jgi:hypothetical protein
MEISHKFKRIHSFNPIAFRNFRTSAILFASSNSGSMTLSYSTPSPRISDSTITVANDRDSNEILKDMVRPYLNMLSTFICEDLHRSSYFCRLERQYDAENRVVPFFVPNSQNQVIQLTPIRRQYLRFLVQYPRFTFSRERVLYFQSTYPQLRGFCHETLTRAKNEAVRAYRLRYPQGGPVIPSVHEMSFGVEFFASFWLFDYFFQIMTDCPLFIQYLLVYLLPFYSFFKFFKRIKFLILLEIEKPFSEGEDDFKKFYY